MFTQKNKLHVINSVSILYIQCKKKRMEKIYHIYFQPNDFQLLISKANEFSQVGSSKG